MILTSLGPEYKEIRYVYVANVSLKGKPYSVINALVNITLKIPKILKLPPAWILNKTIQKLIMKSKQRLMIPCS